MRQQMSRKATSFCDAYTIPAVSAEWEHRYADVIANYPIQPPAWRLGAPQGTPRRPPAATAAQRTRGSTAVFSRIFSRGSVSPGADSDATLKRPKWSKTR
jgi:hypothetical protein